jgi:transposase
MTQKQLHRWHVLEKALEGEISLVQASELLGISYRQTKRLKAKVAREGPTGLLHGNRGRTPSNKLPEVLKNRLLDLATGELKGYNDTHCTETLQEEFGIRISRETLRRIRRNAEQKPKRRRRPPRHHSRRPRKLQEGAMILWDGSQHRWVGDDLEPFCLMAAIDDATGQVVGALFEQIETSLGYLRLLRRVVRKKGIPLSIYQDRHGALKRNDNNWTLEEQLHGEQFPTQVGMALDSLAIQPIFALSAQAKGRVERLFGTLQDRLCAELARAEVRDIDEANRFLKSFIPRFNRRFAIKANNSDKAWRKVPRPLDLKTEIAFRYSARVLNDNTVRLGGLVIDIPAGPARRSYAKAEVEVRQLLDGTWRVLYQGDAIARHNKTPLAEPVMARYRSRTRVKAAANLTLVYQPPPAG